MSLNIENPEADQLAAEVSELAGEGKTSAVINALRERRARLVAERNEQIDATLAEDVLAIAAKIRSRLSGDQLSEADLYDPETGLPA